MVSAPDLQVRTVDYSERLEKIRENEYPYLINEDGSRQVYLDHAGMTLYSKTALLRANEKLLGNLFGNPHSQSLASMNSTEMIDATRLQILELFHADPAVYDIAFTLNSTGAVKLLSQAMLDRFDGFQYMYNLNSHTSLIGIRELSHGFEVFDTLLEANEKLNKLKNNESSRSIPTLVSWTGQSNFNGERFPINEWNSYFKSHENTYTLLDASSLSTTSPPNLSNSITSPDFICVSFYKMFGAPDLGGLIFKKDIAADIFPYKKYFGGGTVDALAPTIDFTKRKTHLTELMEDGTLPIHSISQLSIAIKTSQEIYENFESISLHCKKIREHTVNSLQELKHQDINGLPMVEIHSDKTKKDHGPIVAFSLKDVDGNYVGYYDFEKYASLKNIAVRTGTVCNIGGVSKWLNRTSEDIQRDYNMGHVCGDDLDVIDGRPTGIVRVSFGAMTSFEDIDYFVDVLKDFLTEVTTKSVIQEEQNSVEEEEEEEDNTNDLKIRSLTVYPIKSCKGFSIPKNVKWKVTAYGLQYDRMFCLINLTNNSPLSLKKHRNMTKIHPEIDNTKSILKVFNEENEFIEIKLDSQDLQKYDFQILSNENGNRSYKCFSDPKIKDFLHKAIGIPCTLGTLESNNVKIENDMKREEAQVSLNSLQNKSAFLLISAASLEYLHNDEFYSENSSLSDTSSTISGSSGNYTLSSSSAVSIPTMESRFRGNIIVCGSDERLQPYDEDKWSKILIGEEGLRLKTIAKCDRCHMITIDGETGKTDPSLYIKLATERKEKGKVYFGSNLNVDDSCLLNESGNGSVNDVINKDYYIKLGDKVTVESYFQKEKK